MAGYSGTPLAKKLGVQAGSRLVVIGAPLDYPALLEPLPDGVQFGDSVTQATDIVHAFCTRKSELQAWLKAWRGLIRPDAMVWVSWPKKSANVPTDITEDTIRAVALPLGFVDVKVCAVTEVWSGLKLVIRKTLR
jgi:hypothetical protein